MTIQIVHYDDSVTPLEIEDVAATSMLGMGDGKFVHFQTLTASLFERDTTYYARIRATHPTQLVEELSEQQFQVVFPGSTGRMSRENFTVGDKRAFVVDYRDGATREPLDMVNVTVEVTYYEENVTPV
ncbi:MAG: hypothetical protein Q8P59_01960, partial [Dehalococcoidia bacterium]|nr:hypothetical protein [Dehalococcoidia bacterium]